MPPKRILKPGAAPFQVFDPDGTARMLPIYFDPVSKKETVNFNTYKVTALKFQVEHVVNSDMFELTLIVGRSA